MRFILAGLELCLFTLCASAQGNYEIQVYPSETMAAKRTMIEFHSNFTISGTKTLEDGVYPTNHQFHETIEITHGFNSFFETGFYIFTNIQKGVGWDFVGTHIRPRIRVPEEWHWPVGLSVSQEIGWQKPQYSLDTWTYELRPIVDKQIGKLYLAFNPSVDRALHGPDTRRGWQFSPNFKAGYDITKKVNAGLEYYGDLGPIGSFDPLRDQQQQILPAFDLNLSPNWEINAGVGVGVTHGTDHLLVKWIIGYRFKL
jgi:hypothetical protein